MDGESPSIGPDTQHGQRFEFVGLGDPGNGRVCSQHAICGEQVVVGTLIRLVSVTVEGINLHRYHDLASNDTSIQGETGQKKQSLEIFF